MKSTKQKPVFTREQVERYVEKHFKNKPIGYRVGYQDNASKYIKDKAGCLPLLFVDNLDDIDWGRVRRITVLFSSVKFYPPEYTRDGVRLNTNMLKGVK